MLTSQSTVSGGPQLPAASLRPPSDMVEARARSGPSLQSTPLSLYLYSPLIITQIMDRVEINIQTNNIRSENVNLLVVIFRLKYLPTKKILICL